MVSPVSARKRRRLIRYSVILVVALLIVGYRLIEDIGREGVPGERFVVVHVLDGDTVELRGGDKLRLLAVDTPEKGEPLYNEATSLLERLTRGKEVTVTFAGRRRDRYGRLLGFVYVDDTLLVNKTIIEQGLGYLYLFRDSPIGGAEIKGMFEAQRKAIKSRVGLMGLMRTPEDYYVATRKGYRFHRPGCASVAKLRPDRRLVFNSREEALAKGLSPCRNCQP